MPRGMDDVYDWVDQFRFSRPKKNAARDFSDAVLLAEILAQLMPAWVQLHNYSSTHRFQQKLSNWETLNRKVLTRVKCGISRKHQEDLANAVPGAIELLLIQVKRATTNSPFLQVTQAIASPKSSASSSSRSRASSFTPCSSPTLSSPGNGKQRLLSDTFFGDDFFHTVELSDEQDEITTSFSELLQQMSDTARDDIKNVRSKAKNRHFTAPIGQLNLKKIKTLGTQLLTPNYAKPTLSMMSMARPSSAGARPQSRQLRAYPFALKMKSDQQPISNHEEDPNTKQETSKTDLPSDMNEFQEGSFVYFVSGDTPPTPCDFDDPEEHAQVARVIKSLSIGECLLQLYRRVPTPESPQNSPIIKTRCYSATPHVIDCCSSQLNSIPNMVFDPKSKTCEWQVRDRSLNFCKVNRPKPEQPNSSPSQLYFFTEVLTRVTFTPANLKTPIYLTSETPSLVACVQCPRFSPHFRVPVEPTVFPKVQLNLIFKLPGRFPSRSQRACIRM